MSAHEEFIDTTIAALKIIGMVPKSGKLCVRKGQLSLDVADNAQGLRRWIQGDSRDVTLMHARNTINSAVKISKALSQEGSPSSTSDLCRWTLGRLVAEMEQCDVGLQNLKTTYANDSAMVANLDVLSDRLRAHKIELTKHQANSDQSHNNRLQQVYNQQSTSSQPEPASASSNVGADSSHRQQQQQQPHASKNQHRELAARQ